MPRRPEFVEKDQAEKFADVLVSKIKKHGE